MRINFERLPSICFEPAPVAKRGAINARVKKQHRVLRSKLNALALASAASVSSHFLRVPRPSIPGVDIVPNLKLLLCKIKSFRSA